MLNTRVETAKKIALVKFPIKVRVKEGKVIEIKNEDLSFLQGRVCSKAIAGIWGRV